MAQNSTRFSMVRPIIGLAQGHIGVPVISLSSKCLRQQCRFYAAKPKPARKVQPAPPRTSHVSPVAPVRPRQTQSPARTASSPSRSADDAYVNPTDLFTHTLAQRPSPTLLYVAPASNVFPISSLSVSAFALSYGTYHLYDAFLVPHPGLWWLVPYLNAGVAVFMLGVGTWVGLGSRRLIGTISAVPGHLSQPALAGSSELYMRIEPRRILPFVSKQPIICPLSEVRLTNRVTPLARGDDTKGRVLGRVEKPNMKMIGLTENEIENSSFGAILAKPFKDGLRSLTRSIGRLIGREGFANLEIRGKPWRVDARQGWLLDDGQALDRLMKFR